MHVLVRSTGGGTVPNPWFRQDGHGLEAARPKEEEPELWDVACQPGKLQVGAGGFETMEITVPPRSLVRFFRPFYRTLHVRLAPRKAEEDSTA